MKGAWEGAPRGKGVDVPHRKFMACFPTFNHPLRGANAIAPHIPPASGISHISRFHLPGPGAHLAAEDLDRLLLLRHGYFQSLRSHLTNQTNIKLEGHTMEGCRISIFVHKSHHFVNVSQIGQGETMRPAR